MAIRIITEDGSPLPKRNEVDAYTFTTESRRWFCTSGRIEYSRAAKFAKESYSNKFDTNYGVLIVSR